MLAKVGKVTYNSSNLTVDELDASKLAKIEAQFVLDAAAQGVPVEPFLTTDQAIKEKAASPVVDDLDVCLDPRLNFDVNGILVDDARYKASVDGFVQGGMVIVAKVAQASA